MIKVEQVVALTEEETFHLLEHVIGFEVVESKMKEALKYQKELSLEMPGSKPPCWTCASIARKLGLS